MTWWVLSFAALAAFAELATGEFIFVGLAAALLATAGGLACGMLNQAAVASAPFLIILALLWPAMSLFLRWIVRCHMAATAPPDPNDSPAIPGAPEPDTDAANDPDDTAT